MLKFKLHEYIPYKTITKTAGSISSYLPFLHQSKNLWLPDTANKILQAWLEFCSEVVSATRASRRGCCPPRRRMRVSWTQSSAEVQHRALRCLVTNSWKHSVTQKALTCFTWQRQQYLPAAYRKGSEERLLDHIRLHCGEGQRKYTCVIIIRHCQKQRSERNVKSRRSTLRILIGSNHTMVWEKLRLKERSS